MRSQDKHKNVKPDWWKHGVFYQIYPRSFYDSNGDGIGDINGIIEKLDYLNYLGIDAIWLSPVNRSPMHDFGYDVSSYRDIDPIFGTNKDFDSLIKHAHSRGIKIIMDMVMNHTSHLHPWFLESISTRNSPKRDWYIWSDPSPGGGPPNNWKSAFGGSAWEKDEHTGQFYMHSCFKEQPDLNWRSAEMKETMFSEVQYWLDRGIDGFRLDVVNWFVKDKYLRNNPYALNPFSFQLHKYDRNRPEIHDILREFRTLLNKYEGRMSVGEVFTPPPGNPVLSASFLGDGQDELHLAFDFSLMFRLWGAGTFWRAIKKWYRAIPHEGWPCFVLSNHDQPRGISRFGFGADSEKKALVAAFMLLTLRGTPFLYYGEEIGMKNVMIKKSRIADPLGKMYWPLFPGRDFARTPMQWSSGVNAGFTDGNVWLPVSRDFLWTNVEAQMKDRYSILNIYRRLIKIRREKKSLHKGDLIPAIKGFRGIIAYYRTYRSDRTFIVLNFRNSVKKINLGDRGQWRALISTHRPKDFHLTSLEFELKPYEATIFEYLGPL